MLKRNAGMSLVILCDFDRTITITDVPIEFLVNFVEEDYEKYDHLFINGTITLEQCIIEQFSLLKTSKQQLLAYIDSTKPEIRAGFVEFVEYCKHKNIPIKIVSASLDFVIEHIFQNLGVNLEICAFETDFSDIETGLKLTAP